MESQSSSSFFSILIIDVKIRKSFDILDVVSRRNNFKQKKFAYENSGAT